MKNILTPFLLLIGLSSSCQSTDKPVNTTDFNPKKSMNTTMETATFGAGCFWCVEAIFQQMKGVEKVRSGYMGGKIKNPSYREICTGTTGHAEVIQLNYNPQIVPFDTLLKVFWMTHDPTTLNRQGNDVGTQYRSVVFYHSEEQKQLAEQYKKELNGSKVFDKPIVTEISPASDFYVAEEYHQNYFNDNRDAPYCQYVIVPKVEKFNKIFSGLKK
jgi:peptide-methionine (S)-S-oxide reductase